MFTAAKKDSDSPDGSLNVVGMLDELSEAIDSAVSQIEAINSETRLLAMNARIEAAHAGDNGAAFGIVAEHMQHLAHKTSSVAQEMSVQTSQRTPELRRFVATTVRGTRLADIALTNIDLVDRNLYERTCDVRWWATDSSLVDALTNGTPEAHDYASKRMGVIIGAYTVYLDLVLCDRAGKIVANACPDQFDTRGCDQSTAPWFTQAMQSRSGDDYAFETGHRSPLVGNEPVLVYSCAVRENGETNGQVLGALGILFDWYGLAKPVFDAVPMQPAELEATACYFVDTNRRILASKGSEDVGEKLELPEFERVLQSPRGFYNTTIAGRPVCVGHARAPGFELTQPAGFRWLSKKSTTRACGR